MADEHSSPRALATIRGRVAAAKTPLELKRCHFELHRVLQSRPESVEARRLLQKVERLLEAQAPPPGPQAAPAAAPETRRSPLRPVPWVVAVMVVAFVLLRMSGCRFSIF
jgi:ferric-dicitrate binding protein FerR (iron transport regulator)